MHPRCGQMREKTMMSLSVTLGVFPISRAHPNGPWPVVGSYRVILVGNRMTTPGTLAALNPSGVYCGYFCVKRKYLKSQGLLTSLSVATELGWRWAASGAAGAVILNLSTLALRTRRTGEPGAAVAASAA